MTELTSAKYENSANLVPCSSPKGLNVVDNKVVTLTRSRWRLRVLVC
jgi:hypothetical protein